MRATITLFILALLAGCTQDQTQTNAVLEVTTFNLKTTASSSVFNELDATIEATFTSKQPGFLHRQSGVTEQGNYTVLVYWESAESADASMQKFMSDASVADYASMIEGASMKMA